MWACANCPATLWLLCIHGPCLSHWVDVDAEVKGPSDRYVPESTAP